MADADLAATEDGGREQIVASRLADRHGGRIIHRHVKRNRRIPRANLEEMQEAGLIKMAKLDQTRVRIRVTADGHRHAEAIRARSAPSGAPAARVGALDWDTEVFPVLQAVYRAYSAAPGPMGVRQNAVNEQLNRAPDDERTARVLTELAADGYVEATQEAWQAVGPLMCKLTGKGLQLVANWPSGPGDALAAALLKALDERIGETQSDEEHTRLEEFRDAARDVGVNTLSSVLAKLATGGI